MEKVILTLRGADADDAWCARLRAQVAADLLDIGLPGLAINVRDAEVRDSLMTLTTMDPPVVAFVSVWTQQSYGDQVQAVTARLEKECDEVAAYLVTESVPLPPPPTVAGQRTVGLANVALLRRPADLDESTWLSRWHIDHTPVAIETQSTFGYTQNAVVRALTPARRPSRRSSRSCFRPRRYPICTRSSVRPTTTICATGWSGWSPAPPPSGRTRTSTPCPPVATSTAARSMREGRR